MEYIVLIVLLVLFINIILIVKSASKWDDMTEEEKELFRERSWDERFW